MADARDVFLAKAMDSLASAEADAAVSRYDGAANRCYYACYQAAVAALIDAGVRPPGGTLARWSHSAIQAQFVGQLINRKKQYSGEHRATLSDAFLLRQTGDYSTERVSRIEATRMLRRARELVRAVQVRGASGQ